MGLLEMGFEDSFGCSRYYLVGEFSGGISQIFGSFKFQEMFNLLVYFWIIQLVEFRYLLFRQEDEFFLGRVEVEMVQGIFFYVLKGVVVFYL